MKVHIYISAHNIILLNEVIKGNSQEVIFFTNCHRDLYEPLMLVSLDADTYIRLTELELLVPNFI